VAWSAGAPGGPQLWTPAAPGLAVAVEWPSVDDVRVEVLTDDGDPRVAAAIELVSPRNKDRPRAREAFAAKCADYLGRGCGVVVVDVVTTPYAQLKGNWSSMKNGKPLFHHVLQCVSCWKKELPDGDCRQGRRDYTKCPGTRSRGTWAGDRCYPTASKVHR